jgi:hypothetical protein
MMSTLATSAVNLCGFLFVFSLVLFGFAEAHTAVFGTRLYKYRTTSQSAYSLIQSLLGDFDFEELQQTHSMMGPLFFIAFVAVAVLVIMNVAIAIIVESYGQAKMKQASGGDTTQFVRMVKEILHDGVVKMPGGAKLSSFFCKNSTETTLENAGNSVNTSILAKRFRNKLTKSRELRRSSIPYGGEGGEGGEGVNATKTASVDETAQAVVELVQGKSKVLSALSPVSRMRILGSQKVMSFGKSLSAGLKGPPKMAKTITAMRQSSAEVYANETASASSLPFGSPPALRQTGSNLKDPEWRGGLVGTDSATAPEHDPSSRDPLDPFALEQDPFGPELSLASGESRRMLEGGSGTGGAQVNEEVVQMIKALRNDNESMQMALEQQATAMTQLTSVVTALADALRTQHVDRKQADGGGRARGEGGDGSPYEGRSPRSPASGRRACSPTRELTMMTPTRRIERSGDVVAMRMANTLGVQRVERAKVLHHIALAEAATMLKMPKGAWGGSRSKAVSPSSPVSKSPPRLPNLATTGSLGAESVASVGTLEEMTRADAGGESDLDGSIASPRRRATTVIVKYLEDNGYGPAASQLQQQIDGTQAGAAGAGAGAGDVAGASEVVEAMKPKHQAIHVSADGKAYFTEAEAARTCAAVKSSRLVDKVQARIQSTKFELPCDWYEEHRSASKSIEHFVVERAGLRQDGPVGDDMDDDRGVPRACCCCPQPAY